VPQIFGDFIEPGNSKEYLVLSFSPTSRPIQKRWKNNGLSADFLADYWMTFSPTKNVLLIKKQTAIKDAISFIVNELLENAMKFNSDDAAVAIHMSLYFYNDKIRFYVTNGINSLQVNEFQLFINKLLTEYPERLYITQLENSVNDSTNKNSGLGFLIMLVDYHADLAWKFDVIHEVPKHETVTTMAQINFLDTD